MMMFVKATSITNKMAKLKFHPLLMPHESTILVITTTNASTGIIHVLRSKGMGMSSISKVQMMMKLNHDAMLSMR